MTDWLLLEDNTAVLAPLHAASVAALAVYAFTKSKTSRLKPLAMAETAAYAFIFLHNLAEGSLGERLTLDLFGTK